MARNKNKGGFNGSGGIPQRGQNPAAKDLQDKVKLDKAVQEKLAELQTKIDGLDADYKVREDNLESNYRIKYEELEDNRKVLNAREEDLNKRELEVLNEETALEKKKEQVARDVELEIRQQEKSIREDEYSRLKTTWEEEHSNIVKLAETEAAEKKQGIEQEYEMAHSVRISAEKAYQDRMRSAEAEIEEKYAELSSQCDKRRLELNKKIKEYEEAKANLELEQEDLVEEQEYLNTLKEKYKNSSETEVLRLQQMVEHQEVLNRVSQERLAELSQKLAKLQTRAIEHNGQNAQDRINELEKELEITRDKLDEYSNLPSLERVMELESAEEELRSYRDQLDDVRRKYDKTKEQLDTTLLSVRELENTKAMAAALAALNDQLQKKLQYISEQYKSTQESKFQGLLEIDATDGEPLFDRKKEFSGTLKDLVKYVRNYGAFNRTSNPLYYSEDTIRVFISSLAASDSASRLLILQGLSGTGKSSLPSLFGEALQIHVDFISVQPSWRDNRELLGYDNDFTNRFKETEFTKCVYRASAAGSQRQMVIVVLDEMNLARIEYYFADFLSVLERQDSNWLVPLISSYKEIDEDKQPLYLNYDNGTASLVITKNIWFIGTANNDDSTSLITDKVYDRAQIIDMDSRGNEFEGEREIPVYLEMQVLQELFAAAKRDPHGKMKQEDWEKLDTIDEYLKEMDITFGNRIKNQLKEFVPVYVACGGRKEDAIDYYLAHKILRKLDEKYDTYLIKCLEDLTGVLSELYGEDYFLQSRNKINIIRKRNLGEN